MDYTNNPASNQHPNTHDYAELATIYAHLATIYAHLDSTSDLGFGDLVVTHVFWAN